MYRREMRMRLLRVLVPGWFCICLLSTCQVNGFVKKTGNLPFQAVHSRGSNSIMIPRMAKQFDMSRPVFDLLSLRTIRGDALVRYDALNQSEPLRITLYALVALSLLAAPSLGEAVGLGDLAFPAVVGSYALGTLSIGLLGRECNRRSKQLTRIEKELNTERLPIRLPTNILADSPFSRATTLQDLRKLSNPPRIIAISGKKEKLDQALIELAILGRRLLQANVYVVAIPNDDDDGSKVLQGDDNNRNVVSQSIRTSPWLADPYNPVVWQQYFQSLTPSDNNADKKTDDGRRNNLPSFQWFGLNSSGRSFGSGQDEIPLWLQILGQHLRPSGAVVLSESDDPVATLDPDLLQSVKAFYHALTTGDANGIQTIFSSNESPQVSEVILAGGRLDPWKDCLVEGARPQDMKISGMDGLIVSDTEAYTTVIEFPANVVGQVEAPTLLALQKWTRKSNKDSWQLALHQTIPWSPETKAQGTLRCDCRGCVALTRGPERRTFGGIIG